MGLLSLFFSSDTDRVAQSSEWSTEAILDLYDYWPSGLAGDVEAESLSREASTSQRNHGGREDGQSIWLSLWE